MSFGRSQALQTGGRLLENGDGFGWRGGPAARDAATQWVVIVNYGWVVVINFRPQVHG